MDEPPKRNRWAWSGVALIVMGALCFVAGMMVGDAFVPPAIEVAPLDQPALRVMSFNIRVNTESDGENAWSHRRDMVARTIQFHQADLVGLQESYSSMADDLEDRLPDYVRVSNGETLNPILYRESRLELVSSHVIWLSETPDVESVGWDASTTRTAAYAVFRERRTQSELHVFNIHFDQRGELSRVNSAALVASRVKELPPEARVLVIGDFNLLADSPALEMLEDGTNLRDAFDVSLAPHHGPGGSFKGFKDSKYSGRRVDHIYVRNLVVKQHGILADHYDGRQPSDHYPVLAEVLISQP